MHDNRCAHSGNTKSAGEFIWRTQSVRQLKQPAPHLVGLTPARNVVPVHRQPDKVALVGVAGEGADHGSAQQPAICCLISAPEGGHLLLTCTADCTAACTACGGGAPARSDAPQPQGAVRRGRHDLVTAQEPAWAIHDDVPYQTPTAQECLIMACSKAGWALLKRASLLWPPHLM